MRETVYKLLALAGFLALCHLVGAAGGLLTALSVGGWYASLEKPAWTPPGWVFAPVWTALYTLMAVAAWLVWLKARAATLDRRRLGQAGRPTVPLSAVTGVSHQLALAFFGLGLTLSLAWSGLFFGLRNPGAAMWDLVALWLMAVAATHAFWRISRPAGWLMLPYLLWISFAGALNYTLWGMNRT